MADATEDDPHISSQPGNASDSEDDDLPPDFLYLRTSKSKGSIPKRGTKDFESNATQLQSRTLAASRNAMWDTLSALRVHHATTFERRKVKKNSTEDTREDSGVDQEEESLSVIGSGGTPIGVYDPKTGITAVEKQHVRTSVFATIGKNLSGGGVELLPEEALWALEGSKLDVRYPHSFWKGDELRSAEGKDVYATSMPMSLQGAYAAYIGEEHLRGGSLTLEKYLVYASLKRQGFIVLRAAEWETPRNPRQTSLDPPSIAEKDIMILRPPQTFLQYLSSRLLSSSFSPETETFTSRLERQRLGPLVQPGIYRSYADIFRLISLIPSTDPSPSSIPTDSAAMELLDAPFLTVTPATPAHSRHTSMSPKPRASIGKLSPTNTTLPRPGNPPALERGPSAQPSSKDLSPYTTHWNVYKPVGNTGTSTSSLAQPDSNLNGVNTPKTWKKSSPGPPDFRICVISAADTNVPTLAEMEALWGEQPFAGPPAPRRRDGGGGGGVDPGASSLIEQGGASDHGRSEGIGAVYARLKYGYRGVVLAVVDQGIVSFVRMADAGFGGERLFEREEGHGRGGKGGGGRSRGRGRGRGAR